MPNNEKTPENVTVEAPTATVTVKANPATVSIEKIERRIDELTQIVEGNKRNLLWTLVGIFVAILLAVVNISLQYFKII